MALPFLKNLNNSISANCETSVTSKDARTEGTEMPLSRMIQFISDGSNALHLCLLVPRESMRLNYTERRNPLPPLQEGCKFPTFPTLNKDRKTALVVWLEGMSMNTPNKTTYEANVTKLHKDCQQKDVDIFIFTDAFINKQIDDRCVYIQSIPFEEHSNIDEFLDAQQFGCTPHDVKYGRIDLGKIMATVHILKRTHYDWVAMQDVGKVTSMVHLLQDETLLNLTCQFGIIEGGGSFPENYMWITHKSAIDSWNWVLRALIAFFTSQTNVMKFDSSHCSTLAVMLIRQHFIYKRITRRPNETFANIDDVTYMAERIQAISSPGIQLGGLFPCQYSFLNSERDLKVALKSMALTCPPFANLMTSESHFSPSAVQRRTIALGLITSVMSQMHIQEDYKNSSGHAMTMQGPRLVCSDELVDGFVA